MAPIPFIFGLPVTIPLGAITFTLFIVTMLVGISIRKGWVRINVKYHVYLAVVTLALAIIHASVVFYEYFL
jgi:peptidoglycan/LPS O-acetylase OafA/YrhL